MTQQDPRPWGRREVPAPVRSDQAAGWSAGDWDDDDAWPAGEQPVPPPWPPVPPPRNRGTGKWLVMTAVALAAAAVGAVVVLFTAGSPTGAPTASPATSAPAQGAGQFPGGAAQFPGGSGGGGGTGGTLFMAGTVSAVSANSISLSGQGRTFAAAITGSTKFSGVHGASGIKAGDRVGAVITGYGTAHPVASSIQDPPELP